MGGGGRESESGREREREREGEKGENKEMTPPHTDNQKRARCLVKQCGFTILPHAPAVQLLYVQYMHNILYSQLQSILPVHVLCCDMHT